MSDEELELDLPETRTDFLRSLTMGVEDAKRQRLAAEKEMVAPGGRLGSGDAFTQILTSVLPVVMGAAIAGRRGGMVGAEAGQVANQGLFEAREKSEKEKQAAAKVKYQEASDAERAALAKLSSGTEGMFRDDRFLQGLSHSSAQTDKKLDAMMQRTAYSFDRKDASREDSQSHAKEMLGLKYENDVDLQDSRLTSTEKTAKEALIAKRDNLLMQIEAQAESAGRRMSWEERMTEGKYAQEDKILGIKLTADERKQLRDLDAEKENLKMSLSSRALTSAQDRESREKMAKDRIAYDTGKTDKLIGARKENLLTSIEDRNNRQQVVIRQGQAERQIPGLYVMIDPTTKAPYQLSRDDHVKAADFKDSYGRLHTSIERMRRALASNDRAEQVAAIAELTSKKKEFDNFGAALTGNEERITLGTLPAIFDFDSGSASRWVKGQINGAEANKMLNQFISQLNSEAKVALRNRKYDMDFPPVPGTLARMNGKKVRFTGILDENFKPKVVAAE